MLTAGVVLDLTTEGVGYKTGWLTLPPPTSITLNYSTRENTQFMLVMQTIMI